MDGREVDISQIKGGISDEAMREMQEKMDKEKAEIKVRNVQLQRRKYLNNLTS